MNINVENSSLRLLCETRDRNLSLTMKKLFGKMHFFQTTRDDGDTNYWLGLEHIDTSVILDGLVVSSGCRRIVTLSRAEVKLLVRF